MNYNNKVTAVVGSNWGDEGKGKITDMLAEKADIVVRYQGGANAGHTIINGYGKFALHSLPSGVFHKHITNVIGNGVALSPLDIRKELESFPIESARRSFFQSPKEKRYKPRERLSKFHSLSSISSRISL